VAVERRRESETVAAQNQALQTKYQTTKILHKEQIANADCQQFDEKIDHIVSACQ
jgi:nitrate/nitrite-specific signal transduction histidine kinase